MSMDGVSAGVEWRPAGPDTVKAQLPNEVGALVWRTADGGMGYSAGRVTGISRDRGLVATCNWLACEARAGRLQ